MAWQLWRQDDNGNVFLVGTFVLPEHAEKRLAQLTRCQHKQTYWISETAPPDDAGRDGSG